MSNASIGGGGGSGSSAPAYMGKMIQQSDLANVGYCVNGCSENWTTMAATLLNGDIYLGQMYFPYDITFTTIGCEVTTALAGGSLSLVIYNQASSGLPGTVLYQTGSISMATTGIKSVTGLTEAITAGTYWVGMLFDTSNSGASAVRSISDINGMARRNFIDTSTFAAEKITLFSNGTYSAGSAPDSPSVAFSTQDIPLVFIAY